jgi:hypothetical protein
LTLHVMTPCESDWTTVVSFETPLICWLPTAPPFRKSATSRL